VSALGNATEWLRFLRVVLPTLHNIARDLFIRHEGDAEKAKAHLHTIRDHLGDYRAFEAEIRAKLEKLKAEQAGGK
jgi:hypothetical protein